jgi:hypothetical protein
MTISLEKSGIQVISFLLPTANSIKRSLKIVSSRYVARLPDGIFSNPKYQFGQILEGLAMEDIGIFYGHLVYFTATW